jgi:hypothetical protein
MYETRTISKISINNHLTWTNTRTRDAEVRYAATPCLFSSPATLPRMHVTWALAETFLRPQLTQ